MKTIQVEDGNLMISCDSQPLGVVTNAQICWGQYILERAIVLAICEVIHKPIYQHPKERAKSNVAIMTALVNTRILTHATISLILIQLTFMCDILDSTPQNTIGATKTNSLHYS